MLTLVKIAFFEERKLGRIINCKQYAGNGATACAISYIYHGGWTSRARWPRRHEYVYSGNGEKLQAVHRWNPDPAPTPVMGSPISPGSLTVSRTTDHLGNNRDKQPYQYNGKELEPMHGLELYDYSIFDLFFKALMSSFQSVTGRGSAPVPSIVSGMRR